MKKISTAIFCVSLIAAAFSLTASASADYIVSGYPSGTIRVNDQGSLLGSYYPNPWPHMGVDVGVSVAVSPDLTTVYQFTNSLGSSSAYVYDLESGAYLPDKEFIGEGLFRTSMPLLRQSDPFGKGDMFTIAATAALNIGDLTGVIKRYNRSARFHNTYVDTIAPPTSQRVYDFAFGLGNRLYMAAQQGIFVYQESATGFDLLSPAPLLGGLTGKLTVGPDGHIYVVNSAAGAIQRYGTDGSFIDNFIPIAIDGPETPWTSIQFGVDGNIHVLVKFNSINKYHGTTGAFLSTLELPVLGPTYAYSANGRVTYVPVPEPSAIMLAAFGILLALIRPRGSRRV
jgi:hypothetical protein